MNFFFNNNLSIRAVIVCFYFVLIGLIKGLMGTEIMKIFIPVIHFMVIKIMFVWGLYDGFYTHCYF